MKILKRDIDKILINRLIEPRRFIQVIIGPRQVGKTTSVLQVLKESNIPSHYVSADLPTLQTQSWIEQQWNTARALIKNDSSAILVLDEIQKVTNWPQVIKALWDEDTRNNLSLKVVLLGSSPLLMQTGISESLAGRFETIYATHWTFSECKNLFGFNVDTFIYYGGYPGAAPLIKDRDRWTDYINNSLIETSISRDILLMTRVDKPALLRRLFYLGCEYSGQILSYQKIVGQLQDAGNTTTIAHYLELLAGSGLLTGLSKFSGQAIRRRSSSPKLQVFNTALMSAQSHMTLEQAKLNSEYWGRLVESTVGTYLLNFASSKQIELFYWRKGIYEIDFVVRVKNKLVAIEVKSTSKKQSLPSMDKFSDMYPATTKLLVGPTGINLVDFLQMQPSEWA